MANDNVIPFSPKIRITSMNLQELKTYINSLRPDQINGFMVAVETAEGVCDLRSFNPSYGLIGAGTSYLNLLGLELLDDDSEDEPEIDFFPEFDPTDNGPVA